MEPRLHCFLFWCHGHFKYQAHEITYLGLISPHLPRPYHNKEGKGRILYFPIKDTVIVTSPVWMAFLRPRSQPNTLSKVTKSEPVQTPGSLIYLQGVEGEEQVEWVHRSLVTSSKMDSANLHSLAASVSLYRAFKKFTDTKGDRILNWGRLFVKYSSLPGITYKPYLWS